MQLFSFVSEWGWLRRVGGRENFSVYGCEGLV